MATQNLVTATLSPETKADILAKLGAIRDQLDFMTALKKKEVQGLVKAGSNFGPFLDLAHGAAQDHPDILSRMFDSDEFSRDYQLSKDLTLILNQLNQLTESVQGTLMAVNSDAMVAALEVYAAVRMHHGKVPGLNIVSDGLGEFFKKTKHKEATAQGKA